MPNWGHGERDSPAAAEPARKAYCHANASREKQAPDRNRRLPGDTEERASFILGEGEARGLHLGVDPRAPAERAERIDHRSLRYQVIATLPCTDRMAGIPLLNQRPSGGPYGPPRWGLARLSSSKRPVSKNSQNNGPVNRSARQGD